VEQERLRVLNLLDAGRVTPEQAVALLDALRLSEPAGDERATALRIVPPRAVPSGPSNGSARWLRLRVLDGHGRGKVDLQLPLGLLGLLIRVGSRWLPQLRTFDPDLVLAALQWGGNGKLFEVVDEETGDRVQITFE
jgi:hypothetical protein